MLDELLKNRTVWDKCAEDYENQIVSGHPNIVSLELFEEDFLDSLLRFLINKDQYPITLMDIGCGSGRLHLRYLIKTALHRKTSNLALNFANLVKNASNLKYDAIIAKGLAEIWGIDFSCKMLDLARAKMQINSVLQSSLKTSFVEGSAFDLKPADNKTIPISVCLINTIGIIQKPELLFLAMRRQVEKAGGIACIFCYKKDAIRTFGLGNYESTLDVSGQPKWLIPATYTDQKYLLKAKKYKLMRSRNSELIVDVFDQNNNLVEKDFVLRRDPDLVDQTIQTGHIRTHSDYESYWYSFDQIDDWINKYWKTAGGTYHLDAKEIDFLRAEPEQIAIYDPQNRLTEFVKENLNISL
jgi:ubiquinone/menaquinone biosynthesis C-methylase UbiE